MGSLQITVNRHTAQRLSIMERIERPHAQALQEHSLHREVVAQVFLSLAEHHPWSETIAFRLAGPSDTSRISTSR
jgi:hypothetical protein